jgi:hypothetical protein
MIFKFLKIFKRNEDNGVENKPEAGQPKDYKILLDNLVNEVYAKLKPHGFRKNARTFNRKLEHGIIQVINFQLSQSQYGNFTVNLGVCVEGLHLLQYPEEEKKFHKEYECHIRMRLGQLLKNTDYWWNFSDEKINVSEEIISDIDVKVLDWFASLDSIEKIVNNTTGLQRALIVWLKDKVRGEFLYQEYYSNIEDDKIAHKEYVVDFAKELGIKID